MKILVDKMPEEPYKCPYCKDESDMDMDKYICKWNGSNRKCYDTSDCPFFSDISNSKTVRDFVDSIVDDAFTAHNSLYDHESSWVAACDEE